MTLIGLSHERVTRFISRGEVAHRGPASRQRQREKKARVRTWNRIGGNAGVCRDDRLCRPSEGYGSRALHRGWWWRRPLHRAEHVGRRRDNDAERDRVSQRGLASPLGGGEP